jgi:hypothetical protein
MTRLVPDPLCRWTAVPISKAFRPSGEGKIQTILIRTNSALLLRALAGMRRGVLQSAGDGEDFRWDIVVQPERPDDTPPSFMSKVCLVRAESMWTAHLGAQSFLSIAAEHRYAAGFLALPVDVSHREARIEQYLSMLLQGCLEAVSVWQQAKVCGG